MRLFLTVASSLNVFSRDLLSLYINALILY